ncbi:hypothetical protein Cgig2_022706 [Carnegiea gigantea]|uniref:Pentatricopeptide repeat-containing protein n=1 Tax=Carnegiea gigantea TaxID=171969 RepID=A0A9Q1QCQ2_9CARY|nr:hypothetical protein Cgig2_022706 [Carnegiea gigantea]
MPKLFIFPPKSSIIKYLSHPPPPPPSVSPIPTSLSLLADKCSSMRQLKQVHAQMIGSGRIQDNYAASRLLSFCAISVSGDINYAVKLFNWFHEPNNFMYNTMIRALATSAHPYNALLLFKEMRRMGVLPGKHTFPFILKACSNLKLLGFCKQPNGATLASVLSACAQQECLVLGERIEQFMRERAIELGMILGTALVDMYAKNGAVAKAREVFHGMQEKNIAAWNAMIHGLAVHGHGTEALRLFQKLEKEDMIPNGITFVAA